MRFVSISFGLGNRETSLLRLFNGNIRDCFRFLRRVTDWVLLNGYRDNRLSSDRPRIDQAVNYVLSGSSRKTFAQRGYRLVEFLLFNEGPSFQTAARRMIESRELVSIFGLEKVKRPRIRSNQTFSGFIDNIFNYHQAEHGASDDAHCLVEKIRLLQALESGEWIQFQALEKKVEGLFGYRFHSFAEFRDALFVLLKGGFVSLNLLGGDLLIKRTERAAVVLDEVLERMIYLEHVFHKTLFPVRLIIEANDSPRYIDPDRWTFNSIRNVFCFLSYIRFVESNNANNVAVPERYRISQRVEDSLWRSIEKIVLQDHHKYRLQKSEIWLVSKVIVEVERVIEVWRRRGILQVAE
jgi:hypothetical protein